MGIGKWITGAIGWALGGPLGGLAGYFIGSLLEGDSQQAQRVYQGGGFSANEQRNSFLVSLLVLSAAVMKSDGKVMKSELEYVKDFIRRSFGEAALPQALQILKAALEKDIDVRFSEVDSMGVVWHGAYPLYLEDAREAFGEKYGLTYANYVAKGYYAPIVDMQLQYVTPLMVNDEAVIETRYIDVPAAKICFEYIIIIYSFSFKFTHSTYFYCF